MVRRGRRSGVRFIENVRDRSLTFFKRRSGLYKAAADLSILTGARVAIVLESESGKLSSFGTPAAGPVVNAFLSRNALMGPYINEGHKATITKLQNELFQLEKDVTAEEKRNKDSIALVKEIQESSRIAKFAYGKVEDLDADETREMYHELSRLRQKIQRLLPTPHHGDQHKVVGDTRDHPSLLHPSWWCSLPSQQVPPVLPQTTPIESFIQLRLPPLQLPPRSLATSTMPLQAARSMPTHQEAIPYNYYMWGMDMNGNNNSNMFFQSPILASPPPSYPPSPQIPQPNASSRPASPPSTHQFLLPFAVDGQHPSRAHSYSSTTELSQNFASRSGSSTPTNKPYYYANNLGEVNIELGRNNETIGSLQIGGGHRMLGFSADPLQGRGWIGDLLPGGSSSVGGTNFGDDGAGTNPSGINFPWN